MTSKLNILKFLIQSIGLGLAVGFLIVYFKPSILNNNGHNNTDNTNQSNGPISYASAVKKIAPSVVSIYAQTTLINNSRLNDEFLKFPGLRSLMPQPMTQQYLGSGVIMSNDGYIVTSYHVIKEAHIVIVSLWNNTVLEAKVIGFDKVTDLAVLKIEAINLTPATFTDSDMSQTGDVVMTVGNPFGLSQSVSLGIISAKGRSGINVSTIENFIQTDASINEGNSGGALINAMGNVVGISSATFNQNGAQGINFAIPSNVTKHVMQEILEHGKVFRGWLGIALFPPQKMNRDRITQPEHGVMVLGVYPGYPAKKANFRQYDNITHVDDIAIQNNHHYRELIAKTQPGETLEISGFSKGQAFRKQVKTVDRPPELWY